MARPEKRRVVQSFLQGKLEFEPDLNGPHESFSIPKKLAIFLPKSPLVNLQHGRKDVVAHIVRQIYQFLGLEYKEFLVGKECHICASVIYRALLWKHLRTFVEDFSSNRVAMSAVLEQYLISSEASLSVVMSDFKVAKLNKHELKVAERIAQQAAELENSLSDFDELFEGRLAAFVARISSSF